METETRSRGARVGLLILNLVGPGLGYARLGLFQQAMFWALVAPASVLLFSMLGWIAPPIGFLSFVAFALLALMFQAAIIVVPASRLWSMSRFRAAPTVFWSRWPGLLLIWLAIVALAQVALFASAKVYHSFAVSAPSMAPVLDVGDDVFADMRRGRRVRRGDVVLVRVGGTVFIKRVAALAGDRVGMRAGVPIVDGIAAQERPDGTINIVSDEGIGTAHVFTERLPGEARFHRILKIAPTPFDNLAPIVVPAGRVFLLGDNRDNSDDSRVPAGESVVGLPLANMIVGRPLFIYWSRDRARIGEPVS